jgi:hypothetical protein
MIKTLTQLDQAFNAKVKMIEETNNIDLMTYYVMQVGPEDAGTIMNQLKGFFISGYYEARKDILGA